jgi:hypothetical protein
VARAAIDRCATHSAHRPRRGRRCPLCTNVARRVLRVAFRARRVACCNVLCCILPAGVMVQTERGRSPLDVARCTFFACCNKCACKYSSIGTAPAAAAALKLAAFTSCSEPSPAPARVVALTRRAALRHAPPPGGDAACRGAMPGDGDAGAKPGCVALRCVARGQPGCGRCADDGRQRAPHTAYTRATRSAAARSGTQRRTCGTEHATLTHLCALARAHDERKRRVGLRRQQPARGDYAADNARPTQHTTHGTRGAGRPTRGPTARTPASDCAGRPVGSEGDGLYVGAVLTEMMCRSSAPSRAESRRLPSSGTPVNSPATPRSRRVATPCAALQHVALGRPSSGKAGKTTVPQPRARQARRVRCRRYSPYAIGCGTVHSARGAGPSGARSQPAGGRAGFLRGEWDRPKWDRPK